MKTARHIFVKTMSLILASAILLFSCKKDENSPERMISNEPLVGEWKLAAVQFDTGDGRSTFKSVNSAKTLMFYSDGTLTSNGSIYYITSVESDSPSSGTYSLTDLTISSSDFPDNSFPNRFKREGAALIINFSGCIEACRAKYVRK